MKANQRQRVGKLGLEVTQMGLGGTGFGNMYEAMDDQDAVDTLGAAHTSGIGYVDTAPLYGFGLSESRLGNALSACGRDHFVISTKVGYTLVEKQSDEPHKAPFVDAPPLDAIHDYSRDAVLRSIDESLERLKTDHVDILLIHDPDEGATLWSPGADPFAVSHFADVMEQTYPVLDDLRSQNVIKAIGLGMNQWQMLAEFAKAGDFDCFLLAGRYTLLEQEPLDSFLPLCSEKDIRIIVGGPYNSGILATGAIEGAHYNYGEAPPEILDRVRGIEAVCGRHDVPLQAAALQFPFGHPAIATIIPGARSVDEIRTNTEYFEHEIPGDFWEELKVASLLAEGTPVP